MFRPGEIDDLIRPTATTPHATDHAIRSLRCLIGGLVDYVMEILLFLLLRFAFVLIYPVHNREFPEAGNAIFFLIRHTHYEPNQGGNECHKNH
jgi:hypothetical protein